MTNKKNKTMQAVFDVFTIERGRASWKRSFYANNYKTGKTGAIIAAKVFARKFKHYDVAIKERLFDSAAEPEWIRHK